MGHVLLNVADIRLRSRVNGPGLRSVVWVQGCSIRCPGCFNRHTHPHEPRNLLDPETLGGRLGQLPDTDGLTISGGEPFEQAQACAILASTVLAAGRSVMVFTGHRLETLRESIVPAVQHFLANIDVLVAGPYVKRRKSDASRWRGSTNQTIHLLTDRLADAVASSPADGPVVEAAGDGNVALLTGFPSVQDQQWLDQLLQSTGGPSVGPSVTGKRNLYPNTRR